MKTINFYESTPYVYLQVRQTMEVPSKIEATVRYLMTDVTVQEAKAYPIAILSNTEPVANLLPRVTEAIIKSAEAEVLPGSADELNFGIKIMGLGEVVVKLHIFVGSRNVFIASAKYIAGYVTFGIFKSTLKSRTANEIKELLGIPLDDPKYKF